MIQAVHKIVNEVQCRSPVAYAHDPLLRHPLSFIELPKERIAIEDTCQHDAISSETGNTSVPARIDSCIRI